MFIYGLNEEQGKAKLREIINYFGNYGNSKYKSLVRSERALTFVVESKEYNYCPPIQIVLRLYSHPSEILLGFDLPCVRLCFDGRNFYMLRSCHNAILNGYNLATGFQPFRTGNYEWRLVKYLKRGFNIRVQDWNPERITPQIFNATNASDLTGLAKLLYILKHHVGDYRTATDKYADGTYDPLSTLLNDLAINLYLTPYRLDSISESIQELYLTHPFFMIVFTVDKWSTIFDGSWTPKIGFLIDEDTNSSINDIRPQVGPLRFIGSLQEYLASLPKTQAWYCQAYGITQPDCY